MITERNITERINTAKEAVVDSTGIARQRQSRCSTDEKQVLISEDRAVVHRSEAVARRRNRRDAAPQY
jgi:hypothetical protein